MTATPTPPRLTPDGKPRRPRRTGDETGRSTVDSGQDPNIAGDAGEGGYANTDEARPDDDGLVRRGDQRDPPLI
ncbi:hypothetical protein RB623_17770 [Mesorhizobium sp. LHD-90]|uniref:hypothetical protein n=1 Tax=Mesorhizobium sp. LHD-90 TaxID=3071414 RepID=UPI0027DFFA2E|nr:hypothetical protein [Mesorhizobium sp. LHD-90]MDQ6435907.1 hypothetical protein [Mesorhizobium sp. LHD-90]